MVLETDPQSFVEWFPGASWTWLIVVVKLLAAGMLICYLVAAVRHGPLRAGDLCYKVFVSTAKDLLFISPRRTWAMVRLTIQESIRRWVLAGFGVFVIILLFAVWFLDPETIDPGTLYVDAVLTWTTFLVLIMALLLSALSLPADIKNRTIYTIVTKPVRPSEIVLGRIVGFVATGTVMLVVMGLCSYLFVVRSLRHAHELATADLAVVEVPARGGASSFKQGRTRQARNHRHQITLDAEGRGSTEMSQGHWHDVTAEKRGGLKPYRVGPPQGQFHARVPVYGKLRFKDRTGADAEKGINVGDEWTYRSFLEGGSLAQAIWTFHDLREEDFPERLLLEMTIRVFRTRKGNIEKGILGSLVLRNPRTGLVSRPRNFRPKEYYTDRHLIPRTLADNDGRPIDLFDDLVDEGALEIQLQCLPRSQFFGMAQGDLYLLAREERFDWNFAKGYVGIWLQMVLVTAFGVMWSTFLNRAVALLATLATIVAGLFTQFIKALAAGEVVGGGTFESLARTVQQKPAVVQLEEGLTTNMIMVLDKGVQWLLAGIVRVLPDFWHLSDVNYVSSGFNIPTDLLLIHVVTAASYLLPVFLCGFLFLKLREIGL